MQHKIQEEIEELKKDIQRLGTKNAEGKYVVKFGVLFNDEKTQQYYEVKCCQKVLMIMLTSF
ncbi:unnamed protein product [Paramecium primaurelia]|uniref:Costars domain-containing protein n=2 Tax=Paramecium TaxID=5884 RepID=A0A8S1WAZ6_9CILI|nr:unnamed protein product [Paramecium primaurelia]CAD8187224.1 unnamed protein product [Paramecium pentaurelia]